MNESSDFSKLASLSELMNAERGEFSFASPCIEFRDSVEHLGTDERWGWRRIISSILSAELLEKELLQPLIDSLPETSPVQNAIKDFLRAQARDEERHQWMIQGFLWQTFQFERKGKTLANRIFIDGFLSRGLKHLRRHPAVGLALIHMYEDYSNHFYRHLKKQALDRDLPLLHAMLLQIERDELRHTAGLRMILKLIKGTELEINSRQKMMLRVFLHILAMDITLQKPAFYNWEARRGALAAGLDPEVLASGIGPAIQKTLACV